jgi:CrcB protein
MDAAQTFWVFLFGGLGSVARFGVVTMAGIRLGPGFPWGTLAVNVVGSGLLSALVYAASASDAISPTARITLATGLLGGFTTYSAFSHETFALLQRGETGLAFSYVAATLLGCLLACLGGHAAATALVGSR